MGLSQHVGQLAGLIVILVVAAIPVLYARIGKAGAMMIEQLGAEYRAYMQRLGRVLPRR